MEANMESARDKAVARIRYLLHEDMTVGPALPMGAVHEIDKILNAVPPTQLAKTQAANRVKPPTPFDVEDDLCRCAEDLHFIVQGIGDCGAISEEMNQAKGLAIQRFNDACTCWYERMSQRTASSIHA